MYTYVNPIQDTTIYEQYPYANTGIDSILELSKTNTSGVVYESRPLIKFDLNEINDKINKFDLQNVKYILKLFIATEEEIQNTYTVEVRPVGQTWDNGNGRLHNIPATNGSSWKYNKLTTSWDLAGAEISSSYNTTSGGGNWYTASYCSQSFAFNNDYQLSVDVTPIVELWNSESIDNNGFILLISGSDYGTVKYYSYESETIFQPRLEILSNNSSYISGSSVYETILVEVETKNSHSSSLSMNTALIYDMNKYDVITITSSSQDISITSASYILPTSSSLPGSYTTGSVSGMNLYGGFNGNFEGYVDFASFTGSLENFTFIGYINNESTSTYYSESVLIDSLIVTGSIKGIIVNADITTSSFGLSTISGSYVGNFTFASYDILTQTTSSYEVIMPTEQTLYNHYASQSYYITGSDIIYEVGNINAAVVNIENLLQEYKNGSVVTHKIYVRDLFPELRYTTGSAYLRETHRLPESSSYAVKDLVTDQYIIDFDDIYTKINCNSTGNYFTLDIGTLYPGRYYGLEIKSTDSSINTKYFENYKFKVVK